MWIALEQILISEGLLNVIEALHKDCSASHGSRGGDSADLRVLSGVLQDCPLSGMLFALCLNPFVLMMKKGADLKLLAATRARAADIGAAVRRISVLRHFYEVVNLASSTAGLRLKACRCRSYRSEVHSRRAQCP